MTRRRYDAYYSNPHMVDPLVSKFNIRGTVIEPCVGVGRLLQRLPPSGHRVITNDIDPDVIAQYHEDACRHDARVWSDPADWVITNPPFSKARDILDAAFASQVHNIAFLVRLSFLEPTRDRSGLLQAHNDKMVWLGTFGSPRPRFTKKGTDTVTTAWLVWRADWSWAASGIQTPFDFLTGWL